MARVSVEDCALKDWRFDELGRRIGSDRFGALGRMVHLWSYCTERETYVVPALVVDGIMGYPGASEVLVAVDLAEIQDDGVRIKGTKGRIEWLGARRAAGRAGGSAAKTSRSEANASKPKQSRSKREANGKHSEAGPKQAGSGAEASAEQTPNKTKPLSLSLSGASYEAPGGAGEPPRAAEPDRKPNPDHARFVAFWTELFAEHRGGAKPTWPKERHGQVKHLLSLAPLEEICRRARILFEAPPRFLADGAADLGTLVSHFDKLASPAREAAPVPMPGRRPPEPPLPNARERRLELERQWAEEKRRLGEVANAG